MTFVSGVYCLPWSTDFSRRPRPSLLFALRPRPPASVSILSAATVQARSRPATRRARRVTPKRIGTTFPSTVLRQGQRRVFLHGRPQRRGDGLHPFVARMAGHSGVIDLPLGACGVRPLTAERADIDEHGAGLLGHGAHDL